MAKSSFDTVLLIGEVFIELKVGFDLKTSLFLVIKQFGVSKSCFFSAIHALQKRPHLVQLKSAGISNYSYPVTQG